MWSLRHTSGQTDIQTTDTDAHRCTSHPDGGRRSSVFKIKTLANKKGKNVFFTSTRSLHPNGYRPLQYSLSYANVHAIITACVTQRTHTYFHTARVAFSSLGLFNTALHVALLSLSGSGHDLHQFVSWRSYIQRCMTIALRLTAARRWSQLGFCIHSRSLQCNILPPRVLGV